MLRHISWTQQFHTWTPTEILLRSQKTRVFHWECVAQVDTFAPTGSKVTHAQTFFSPVTRTTSIRELSCMFNPDWLSICKFVKMAFNSRGVIFIAEYHGCIVLHAGVCSVAACFFSCTRASTGHRLWIVSKAQQLLLQKKRLAGNSSFRRAVFLVNSPFMSVWLYSLEETLCMIFAYSNIHFSFLQNIRAEDWKSVVHFTFHGMSYTFYIPGCIVHIFCVTKNAISYEVPRSCFVGVAWIFVTLNLL